MSMFNERIRRFSLKTELDKRTGADERGFYIRTFSGKQFFWNDIEHNEIDIRDIAHGLAMNCRWTGHTKWFYSVAQHCVLASYLAPIPHRLAALLHDGAEAYVHDTPSPLKWHLKDKGFTAFSELEKSVDRRIFEALGVAWPRDPSVKRVDMRLLATEHRDLMPNEAERNYMDPPYDFVIRPWTAPVAEELYLMRYKQLSKGAST